MGIMGSLGTCQVVAVVECPPPHAEVMSPYSGSTGDLMTMVEPALAAATQDIESSNTLPGSSDLAAIEYWTLPCA